jgi:ribosomal peptide maturation radical SAM protein 1
MEEVPLPVYDEYFERLQGSPLAAQMENIWIPYESARGCWWALRRVCTFCAANAQNMSFRSRKPEAVLRDVVTLSKQYPTPKLWFVDNIMDERYLHELFPEMCKAGYRVPMFVETRAHIGKDELRAMAEAGVIMIQLGLESFSTPILNGMQKGTSALQNIRVLKWCAEFGIQCFYNVIYGFPGEPTEEYERMADTVASLTHLQAPNTPVRLRLDRFSPYHYNPDNFGIEIEGPRPSRRFVYDLPDADLMEIEYFFTFRYKDNRDPESYVAAFKEACATWRHHWRTNFRQLSYDQVGDGLRIVDLRNNMLATVYALGALEASIYLACDSGASIGMILKRVAETHDQQLTAQDVRSFLQAVVAHRLMYEEGGKYLALAVCSSLSAPNIEAGHGHRTSKEEPRYVQLRMHAEALHA